jgi:hypothetical protein
VENILLCRFWTSWFGPTKHSLGLTRLCRMFSVRVLICACASLRCSSQLASLLLCLQEITLDDAPDQRLMKLTGKQYTSRDAYYALDCNQEPRDVHGQRIWSSRVPNKVKIFSWLYFRDRLSTWSNLFAKHILDDDLCERCTGHIENRHHVFFGCQTSSGVWSRLNLASVANLSDVDVWNATVPANLDAKLWPFILQTIL